MASSLALLFETQRFYLMLHIMNSWLTMRSICRALALCLMPCLLACTLASCTPQSILPLPGSSPDISKEVTHHSPDTSTGTGEVEDDTIKEELRDTVDVKQVNSYLTNAGDALSRNYKNFLAREPQKFSLPNLFASWGEDVTSLPDDIARAQRKILTTPPWKILPALMPLIVCLIFLILLTLLDRQVNELTYRWHHSYHSPISTLVTRTVRTLILVFGRILSPLILVGLSYFPIRALFGDVIWTRLTSDTFWVLFIYRLLTSSIEIALAFPWLELSDAYAAKLRRILLILIQIGAIATQLLTATLAFELAADKLAFIIFCFELFIAMLPVGLVSARHALSSLFSEREESTVYLSGLRWVMRHYFAMLILTSLLLVMRAFGYVNASTSLLTRGYGLVGLLLLGSLLLRSTRMFFDDRLTTLDLGDPQRELFFSIKRLLTLAFGVVLILGAARIIAIYDPLIILLKTPLLTLQSVQFSLFNLISAVLIVGVALLCSKIVRAILNASIYPSLNVDIGVAYAINTIVGYAVIVVGFFLVLIALGVNLSALTVVAASLSVGIGFGLQTLTENIISGFIILFGRTVRKGDYITIHEVYGRVEAVGARSVVVRTPDNYDLLIPSKELVGGALINWTYQDPTVRLHVPVGVSYSCDPRQVEEILLETVKKYGKLETEPSPEVWLVGFGDSSVNFELLVHYDCRKIIPKRIMGELNYLIWTALQDAGVEIPFPQRDLHLRSTDILPELKSLLGGLSSKDEDSPKKETGDTEDKTS